MLGHWINIYNLCFHIVVLKKISKVVKNCSSTTLFGQKLGQHGPHPKWSSFFYFGNNKRRSEAFKNFLFHQNIIRFDWVLNDFLTCVILCCQNQPFPAEKDVGRKRAILFPFFNTTHSQTFRHLFCWDF